MGRALRNDVYVQVEDDDGNLIGTPVLFPAGTPESKIPKDARKRIQNPKVWDDYVDEPRRAIVRDRLAGVGALPDEIETVLEQCEAAQAQWVQAKADAEAAGVEFEAAAWEPWQIALRETSSNDDIRQLLDGMRNPDDDEDDDGYPEIVGADGDNATQVGPDGVQYTPTGDGVPGDTIPDGNAEATSQPADQPQSDAPEA